MTGKPLNKTILVSALVLLAFCAPTATSGAATTYLDYVNSSLSALEQGKTLDATAELRKAMTANANDSLGRTVLGLALLMGGRVDDARAEFTAATELDPGAAEALYGLGLVMLKKANLPEAARYFAQAQQARPDVDMQSSIGYVKWLAGGEFDAASGNDECTRAMRALALMKQSDFAGAKAIWTELATKAERPEYGERIGCSMTLLRNEPLVATGWPLGKTYKPIVVPKNKLVVVSGTLDLKADLSRAQLVKIVSFFVDGNFVGMTNTPPFHYLWDTTRTPNGVHTLKITGIDAFGTVVTEKSTSVLVKNKGSVHSGNVSGDGAEQTRERLWNALALKPSVAAINYNLALCNRALGDVQAAKAALERVLAARPGYSDAARLLSSLCGSDGSYIRLYKGDGNRKVIALTFDDGPRRDSGRLLDVLKSKNVKATFFVVGSQVRAWPQVTRRMAEDGHEIGNHTYSHRDLEYLSEEDITQEVFRTAAAVRSATGLEMRYLRPPGGHEGTKLPSVLRRFGITPVYWTSNTSGLEGTTRKKIYDYVVSTAKPGGIVLMHNMELCTLEALPDIIDTLRAKGYSFVTLSELRKPAT